MRNFMAYFKFERLIVALGNTLAMLTISFAFTVAALNWAMGCGQAFYYPDGTWRTGECFLIPYETKAGYWRAPSAEPAEF